jgi:hypothetical protein
MAENLAVSYPKAVEALFKETQGGCVRKRDFTAILAFIALVEEWDEKEREFIASLTKDKKRWVRSEKGFYCYSCLYCAGRGVG